MFICMFILVFADRTGLLDRPCIHVWLRMFVYLSACVFVHDQRQSSTCSGIVYQFSASAAVWHQRRRWRQTADGLRHSSSSSSSSPAATASGTASEPSIDPLLLMDPLPLSTFALNSPSSSSAPSSSSSSSSSPPPPPLSFESSLSVCLSLCVFVSLCHLVVSLYLLLLWLFFPIPLRSPSFILRPFAFCALSRRGFSPFPISSRA